MHPSLVKFHPLFQEILWIQELNAYGDGDTYADTDANINGPCCTKTYMSPLTFGEVVGGMINFFSWGILSVSKWTWINLNSGDSNVHVLTNCCSCCGIWLQTLSNVPTTSSSPEPCSWSFTDSTMNWHTSHTGTGWKVRSQIVRNLVMMDDLLFRSFSTVFQSYQDNGLSKLCRAWNLDYYISRHLTHRNLVNWHYVNCLCQDKHAHIMCLHYYYIKLFTALYSAPLHLHIGR